MSVGAGTSDRMQNIALWSVLGGVTGARLYHIATAWELFAVDSFQGAGPVVVGIRRLLRSHQVSISQSIDHGSTMTMPKSLKSSTFLVAMVAP